MLRDLFLPAPARVNRAVSTGLGDTRGRPSRHPGAGPRELLWLALACGVLGLAATTIHAAETGSAAAGTSPAATAPAAAPSAPAAAASASKKRYFKAEISWANNTYYTPSQASGHAEFELDVTTHKLRWTLTFKDLSSPPTKVTLHAPAQPGATGAAIMDLAPQGLKSPATGEGQLTDAQVEYLLTGWSYALVTTRKYPQGEARGQLDRVRTPLPAFAQANPPAAK